MLQEKKNLKFDQNKFAILISKLSKTQVVIIRNTNELINYFKKKFNN